MNSVISELCYKVKTLQRNCREMTILWLFSYISFVKFHGKKFGSHHMTMLNPNLCYIEMYYKGMALYV